MQPTASPKIPVVAANATAPGPDRPDTGSLEGLYALFPDALAVLFPDALAVLDLGRAVRLSTRPASSCWATAPKRSASWGSPPWCTPTSAPLSVADAALHRAKAGRNLVVLAGDTEPLTLSRLSDGYLQTP